MYDNNYLAQQLSKAAQDSQHRVFAHLPDGSTLTYQAFFQGAEQLAAVLVENGLQAGDRVAVQAQKSIGSLQLYFATVLAGGVFLPLNPAYTADELDYFLGNATPHVFVCDPVDFDNLATLAQTNHVAVVFTLAGDGSGTLQQACQHCRQSFTYVARSADDLAAILYTSGTTGRSKGVMLSHNNLASNAAVLTDYWAFTVDDVLIHALPIFHTHGLFVATNVVLMAAASLIFMPTFDSQKIIDVMPKATALMGVPTFYVRLLKSSQLATAAQSMRLFISGSAPLLEETHQRWQEITGHAILERYGMTETNMNTSNPYYGERRAGTVGFPLPGVELRITDAESGNALPQGTTGIIEVRGPNVFQGYWQMPDKTAEELRENGFFITGDIGIIDADGYVSIVGRNKDLIISGGYNVYPKEIELLIDKVSGVLESAVIGAPHPDFGEGVIAIVVCQPNQTLDSDTVQQAIEPKLARYKQPKKYVYVDELPRNSMGKVQKNVLRDNYREIFNS